MTNAFRHLLDSAQDLAVTDAISPWLGWSLEEAILYRKDPSTQDGLNIRQFYKLLGRVASTINGAANPALAAGLLKTYAPICEDVEWLQKAIAAISTWLDTLDEDSFYEIICAHRIHEEALASGNGASELPSAIRAHDHVITPLSRDLLIEIEIASNRWLVAAVQSNGDVAHCYWIPFDPGDNGSDGWDGPNPTSPHPFAPTSA